jgi:chromatin segregation and condensation protein Rec8/ScpA/Scc1 (kleisin family)
MQTPEAVDVTSAVLRSDAPPSLVQMVHHPETRPVSLLELIRAFGEAETDARSSIRQQELRERLRDEQRSPPEVLVHGEIPERDVDDAWAAAKRHPVGEPFPFLALWKPAEGRERLVALFLAALYLARERSVEFSQEKMLVTPLCLVRTAEERTPLIVEAH